MKTYTTVVFDLDGTLLDTLQDLCDSVNYALSHNNMPVRTLDEVRRFVGNGIRNLIIRAVPEGEETPGLETVFADFKAHYAKNCRNKTAPYPGVMEMVRALKAKGKKLAIVSNKVDSAVQYLLHCYFEGVIDIAVGEMEGVSRKPAPDMVYKALELLGSTVEESVYIGDSEVDILTAKNSRMDCISVTWGFRERELLEETATGAVLDTPKEVEEYLL